MNIGIIGSGAIGGTLALKLSAAGHRITLANSRGADTIPERYLAPGVQAGDTRSLPQNLDVLILSVPPQALPQLVDVITGLPDDTILVDTSNYYPGLNGQIDELNQGKTQAIWVAEQLGRPIIKTWNAVLAEVLQNPSGPLACRLWVTTRSTSRSLQSSSPLPVLPLWTPAPSARAGGRNLAPPPIAPV